MWKARHLQRCCAATARNSVKNRLNQNPTYSLSKMNFSNGHPQKSPDQPIMDYSRFLNEHSAKRHPSLIRELTKMLAFAEPGTIFMAGGLPNPTLFPFSSLSVTVEDPSGTSTQQTLSGPELRSALQYQPTLGYPPLHEALKTLVQDNFAPPPKTWANTELIVTVGSQNALSGLLDMCLKPGDPIVIPGPCYSSALSIIEPYSPEFISVPEDQDGMQPSKLRHLLQTWHSKNPSSQRPPKLLYINPTGGNPSGIVIPTERKKEIYAIAQEYDLLILEDDPYYFLHFLEQNPTTFFQMDVDGRVVRLDSFSKILSSGLRVGFCTGPRSLIRTLEICLQASILHTASLSQVLVNGVLRSWGQSGFLSHVGRVTEFYKKRRDLMIKAAETHLTGLATWEIPKGGMFLWLKVLGVKDTYTMVMERGIQLKIMALPGREFMADKTKPCEYIRLSFSVIPEEQIEEGIVRLAKLIKEERAIQANK